MKKISLFLCLLLVGCVSVDNPNGSLMTSEPIKKRDLTNINLVYDGMTYQEVLGVMGRELTVGYKKNDANVEIFDAQTMTNPHREEELVVNGLTYKILFYFTHVNKPDGMVAEDELTPLVFEDEKLIGKGSDFLHKLRNQGVTE